MEKRSEAYLHDMQQTADALTNPRAVDLAQWAASSGSTPETLAAAIGAWAKVRSNLPVARRLCGLLAIILHKVVQLTRNVDDLETWWTPIMRAFWDARVWPPIGFSPIDVANALLRRARFDPAPFDQEAAYKWASAQPWITSVDSSELFAPPVHGGLTAPCGERPTASTPYATMLGAANAERVDGALPTAEAAFAALDAAISRREPYFHGAALPNEGWQAAWRVFHDLKMTTPDRHSGIYTLAQVPVTERLRLLLEVAGQLSDDDDAELSAWIRLVLPDAYSMSFASLSQVVRDLTAARPDLGASPARVERLLDLLARESVPRLYLDFDIGTLDRARWAAQAGALARRIADHLGLRAAPREEHYEFSPCVKRYGETLPSHSLYRLEPPTSSPRHYRSRAEAAELGAGEWQSIARMHGGRDKQEGFAYTGTRLDRAGGCLAVEFHRVA